MDARKRLALILVGMIVIIPLLNTGCFKKGDDDPFVSMYTRKQRMTGTWKRVYVMDSLNVDVRGVTPTLTIIEHTDADWSQKIIFKGTDSVRNLSGEVDPSENYIEFSKFGTFKEVLQYTYYENISIDEEGSYKRLRTNIREENTGTWNFLGKVEDGIKNKERIVMNYEYKFFRHSIDSMIVYAEQEEGETPTYGTPKTYSVTERFKNGELSDVWYLIGLRNKEIKMERVVANTYNYNDGMTNNNVIRNENGRKYMELNRR